MASEKRSKVPTATEPPFDWTVERLVGIGALTLVTALTLIYFISP